MLKVVPFLSILYTYLVPMIIGKCIKWNIEGLFSSSNPTYSNVIIIPHSSVLMEFWRQKSFPMYSRVRRKKGDQHVMEFGPNKMLARHVLVFLNLLKKNKGKLTPSHTSRKDRAGSWPCPGLQRPPLCLPRGDLRDPIIIPQIAPFTLSLVLIDAYVRHKSEKCSSTQWSETIQFIIS